MGLYGHVYTHVSTGERGWSRVRRREEALGDLQSRCPWRVRLPRQRPGWRARRPGWRFPLRQRQRHRLGTPPPWGHGQDMGVLGGLWKARISPLHSLDPPHSLHLSWRPQTQEVQWQGWVLPDTFWFPHKAEHPQAPLLPREPGARLRAGGLAPSTHSGARLWANPRLTTHSATIRTTFFLRASVSSPVRWDTYPPLRGQNLLLLFPGHFLGARPVQGPAVLCC